MAFFCIHYGGFCAGHGFFLVAIFEIGGGPDSFLPDATLSGVPWFVELLRILITRLWTTRLIWPFLALVASHGISFAEHYVRKGERFRLTLADLMLHPYKRIAILHIAILGAGAFIEAFQSPLPLLVALVLLKIGLDILLHCRSHRSRSEPTHQAANSVES